MMIKLAKNGEHPRHKFICDHCSYPLHDHVMDLRSPPICPHQPKELGNDRTRYHKTSTTFENSKMGGQARSDDLRLQRRSNCGDQDNS